MKLSRRLCKEALDIAPAVGLKTAFGLKMYAEILLAWHSSTGALDDIKRADKAIRQAAELTESEEHQSDDDKISLLKLSARVKCALWAQSRLAADKEAAVECSEKLIAAIEATGQRKFEHL